MFRYIPFCFIVLSTIFTSSPVIGQNFDRLDIPFIQDGRELDLPYVGGLRGGQFSNIDFNGDGVMDLFVFDRNGNQIIPLIKNGVGNFDFTYAPEYIANFPALQSWAILVDFNKDGVPDIYSSSSVLPGSIEVWKGSISNDRLSFKRLTFNYGEPDILMIPAGGAYTQIYVNSIDLPAIVDVDNDGDIDIFSFEPDGSFLQYYQNVSVEEGLGPDSIKYVRKDLCWGKFSENQFNEGITLSNDPFSCANGFTSGGNTGARHSGSTVCIFDNDGDQDMDLLLGDLSSSKIKLLTNAGDSQTAFMTSYDANFPSNDVSVNLDIFLASFYVDVNGDGKRDMIVTPNEAFNGASENHVWLYENVGTDSSPIFNFVKDDFLIDEMIYFNSASHPAFFDYNADGLQDILVGSNGIIGGAGTTKENHLYLLKNIGTQSSPSYQIEDRDYLKFSIYDELTGRFSPAFGDMDGDGDIDLIIGDVMGLLYYLENTAGKDNPVAFKTPIYEYKNIFIGQHAHPQIIDLDNDGLNDLVIGEKNNQLNFFKNIGTTTSPDFGITASQLPNTDKLGNIFASGSDFDTQSGTPFFINQRDTLLLLMGTETGSIKAYDQIENNIYGNFNKINEKVGNINQGRRVAFSLADIDLDGYYEMAIGNERGGLVFYNTIFKVDGFSSSMDFNVEPIINIFPNPTSATVNIVSNDIQIQFVRLYNSLGKEMLNTKKIEEIDLSNFHSGVYILKIIDIQGREQTRKIFKK